MDGARAALHGDVDRREGFDVFGEGGVRVVGFEEGVAGFFEGVGMGEAFLRGGIGKSTGGVEGILDRREEFGAMDGEGVEVFDLTKGEEEL